MIIVDRLIRELRNRVRVLEMVNLSIRVNIGYIRRKRDRGNKEGK